MTRINVRWVGFAWWARWALKLLRVTPVAAVAQALRLDFRLRVIILRHGMSFDRWSCDTRKFRCGPERIEKGEMVALNSDGLVVPVHSREETP